jgi:hypothetical protein
MTLKLDTVGKKSLETEIINYCLLWRRAKGFLVHGAKSLETEIINYCLLWRRAK